MYSEKLEKLIELALADGVLTDKKKQVLLKNAEAEGIDLDEFEMVLDAKVYERQQNNSVVNNVVVEQPVPKPVVEEKKTSIQTLFQLLNEAEETSNKELDAAIEQRRMELNKLSAKDIANLAGNVLGGAIPGVGLVKELFSGGDDDDATELDKEIYKLTARSKERLIARKKSIISNFPIPTLKDEAIEFLSNATPYAKKQGNFFSGIKYEAHNELVPTWKLKCEQIIRQANLSFKNDASTMNAINEYAKQLKKG
ncbi:MAG: hypothetical protein LBR26_10120 [Prevotella sp.]|jgi:hypothetical protein|nr:hypothetical protein [Prevotella sp.]